MKKKIAVGLVALLMLAVLIGAFVRRPLIPDYPIGNAGGGAVAVIFVEGIITGGRSQGDWFGVSAGSHTIMEQLRRAREDSEVRAVVLRINSPGGSAAASQEISQEIMRLKETGKPVVASMGDAAASGGYWIAASADAIVANPATITGSIGVIMELQNWQELYDKIGIDFNIIKSGPHKDMGSSARELTAEERDILQGMVDDIHRQFVTVVAEGRNMPREEVQKLADGRIFTGQQAYELGLVDHLGNYYDAIDVAAELAGIPGEPEIRTYGGTSPWDLLWSRSGMSRFFLPRWNYIGEMYSRWYGTPDPGQKGGF